jgi:hypothetical protein
MEIQTRKWIRLGTCEVIVLMIVFVVSTSQACDEALNPQSHGDWDHTNSPMQTYRRNCHPAQAICQLRVRPITKKESDLNQRKASGADLGTPTRPLPLDTDTVFGPEIGKTDSLNQTSARKGPAIKDC